MVNIVHILGEKFNFKAFPQNYCYAHTNFNPSPPSPIPLLHTIVVS